MDLHRRSLESTLSKPRTIPYVLPFIVHATNRTALLPRRWNGFVWGLVSGRCGAPRTGVGRGNTPTPTTVETTLSRGAQKRPTLWSQKQETPTTRTQAVQWLETSYSDCVSASANDRIMCEDILDHRFGEAELINHGIFCGLVSCWHSDGHAGRLLASTQRRHGLGDSPSRALQG